MLNRLKLRMVLANVATAGLIVVAMAAIAYVMITGNIQKQSIQTLHLIAVNIALQSDNGDINFNMIAKIMGKLVPYFVLQNGYGGPYIVSNFETGVNDEEVKSTFDKVMAARTEKKQMVDKSIGDADKRKLADSDTAGGDIIRIGERAFRYIDVGNKNGISYLVFLDATEEETLRENVLVSLGICVLAALVLVLFGGLFLAGRSIRPVRAAWQRQRDFVADASHELRSPLAALRASLEAVQAHPEVAVADRQDFLNGMGEELVRMSRLVDDMLLIARADSGAIVFSDENVNIASVAERSAALMQPAAQQKGLTCIVEIQAAPLVRGDGERLKQVLLILLDNAVKYTPAGGNVRIAVKYELSKAIVEVSDTGIGIAAEHREAIFERFFRVDKARSREAGGQGLGLSIAKWIVVAHHGSISVSSELGKGSVFTVTLPEAK